MDERLKKVYDRIYLPLQELSVTAYVTPEPLPFSERTLGSKKSISVGDRWGKLWDCAWMNMTCKGLPPAEAKNAVFLIDVGGEGCVFDAHGVPRRGITNKDSFYSFELGMPGKIEVPCGDVLQEGQKPDIWVDCGANDLFGERRDAPFEPIGVLHTACLALCDGRIKSLYYDLEVILYLKNATEDEKLRADAGECFDRATEIWESDLASAESLTKAFLSQKSDDDFCITTLGHAHIDLAWLWPIRETKRKAERTLSTVLRNAERYGDYIFGVSQPQLLYWVKERQPELFAQLKELYASGRLELQGGFWVESDTNVPCGESLMRQMLYGKKFFRDEFGYEQEILWIPDVFGYSAQLPQIMRLFGIKYFLTIKMSWNSVNKFPFSTFNWIGLDGSTVLTHMPPEGNYNSAARPESLLSTKKKFRERDIDNRAMLLYGIGDGGGGPGEEHLERLRREYDLRGLPRVKQGKAIDFFNEIAADREKFPSYSGELYLEKHQGTYTTQARNKRGNRKSEYALHLAELLSASAERLAGKSCESEKICELWKEVLLYQFHDIIPGSSIKRVYDETDERYAYILNEAKAIAERAEKAICREEDGESVFNPSPFPYRGFIRKENGYAFIDAPEMSFTLPKESPYPPAYADESTLSNGIITVVFGKNGCIAEVRRDEDGFQALCGDGNVLRIYEDNENAWEVPADYAKNKSAVPDACETAYSVTDGVAERSTVYRYGGSIITQRVTLAPGSSRLDFRTHVSWHETNRMLRSSFPLSVKSDSAQCEIQYGCIDRPTHRRDSFAMAKKEICAHRFVDISDGENGISLLNDCKYGYRVWDCVLDIDLLRSSMYPGVDADKGEHDFTYSLYLHRGDWRVGSVSEGAALNDPPFFCGSRAPEELLDSPLFRCGCGHASVDWIKRAEDGKGVIARIYEYKGLPEKDILLSAGKRLGFTRRFLCDGDENILRECGREIPIGPFEVLTVRFE